MNQHQIVAATKSFQSFLFESQYKDFDDKIIALAKRSLLDLICVAAVGRKTELSSIIHNHAVDHFPAGKKVASLIFDGRKASTIGAAMANGMTIDAIDAHDGYKPSKGHIGCGLLPSLLAFAESEKLADGKEFLARLIIGYEIGGRCATALHATVPDYHTSGAWIAPTCAALGARALDLTIEQMRHAIGIAEYHGPRSQMMRVIDHPTMLKDGSGMGAMIGTQAAYLAQSEFTGAPAISIEGEAAHAHWLDLGTRWIIDEQYIKPWPVCRWAQPPAQAMLELINKHQFNHTQIDHIEVTSFHEAIRLATREPKDTEQAQYSLPWPVASIAVKGKIGIEEIMPNALQNKDILRLSNSIIFKEKDAYNEAFPNRRIADVVVHLKDGTTHASPPTEATGDPENPFSNTEMEAKFYAYCEPEIGSKRTNDIWQTVQTLENEGQLEKLIELITKPI